MAKPSKNRKAKSKPKTKPAPTAQQPEVVAPVADTPPVQSEGGPIGDVAAETTPQADQATGTVEVEQSQEPPASAETASEEAPVADPDQPEADPEPEPSEDEAQPEDESSNAAVNDSAEDPVDEDEDEDEGEPLPSAAEERVQLGRVCGRLLQIPLDAVRGILGEGMSQRIETIRSEASIEAVQKRMLATDGRATPVIFSHDGDGNAAPALVHGVEAIAAAINNGAETIPVVIIAVGDVGEVQSHLVAEAQQKPKDSEDDLYVLLSADD